MQDDPGVLLSRLGLRLPPEDEAPLQAYMVLVVQALDSLYSVPVGETGPAVTFEAPAAEG
ncbi:MAG TPA: hypothetical protein VNL95_04460 [Dehalococcoidia bacterium]|nr:hypothetical protein [Dehalococcoidia bacterium]